MLHPIANRKRSQTGQRDIDVPPQRFSTNLLQRLLTCAGKRAVI
jgi:hypothetical protein